MDEPSNAADTVLSGEATKVAQCYVGSAFELAVWKQ